MLKCQHCPNRTKFAFCNMSESACALFEENSISMEYPRGTVIFREGEHCDAIFVMCSGRVKITTSSREGRTMILRVATGGSVLGLSAALAAGDYEVTAEAIEPCHIRVLHVKTLAQLLREHSDVSLGVAKSLSQDYWAAFEEARRIALPENPAGRLARLLLDWSEDAGILNASGRMAITMPLTHEEIASMAATTRETVTRTLSRFKKDQLITAKGVSFTILQPEKLQEISTC